jgi:hypothetical protein
MDLVGAVLPEPEPALPPDPFGDEVLGWVPAEPSWQVTDLVPDPALDPVLGQAREFGAEWPPPALLDGTDPGPLLAGLVAEVDLSSCSDDAVVGLASAAVRLQAWAASLEVAATAALVERAGAWRGVTPSGRPVRKHSVAAERICSAELAAALGLSERAAAGRVALAQDLQRLPATRIALAAGRLHLYTARMVVDTLRPLDDEAAGRVDAAVVPRYAGRSYTDVSRALRRAVLAADPDAAEQRRQRGVEDRTVEAYPLPDGMATAAMTGPAEDVEAFVTFLTGAAEAANGPGDTRTLAQRRFDVLADLGHTGLAFDTTRPDLLAQLGGGSGGPGGCGCSGADCSSGAGTRLQTRQGRRPTIHVVVSVETLLGLRDEPGELAGYGPITAQTARRIAADGTWHRLLTDPRTGRFDELSVDSYEPPQDMRDHVIARDPVCIGLGCRLPANRCDLDHRVPHPRGPTAASNLDPWCRSGHGIKTFTDTEVVADPDDPDGARIVTYPTGRSYRLPAEPVLEDFGLTDSATGLADGPDVGDDPPF